MLPCTVQTTYTTEKQNKSNLSCGGNQKNEHEGDFRFNNPGHLEACQHVIHTGDNINGMMHTSLILKQVFGPEKEERCNLDKD